jgi:hypothetical protein
VTLQCRPERKAMAMPISALFWKVYLFPAEDSPIEPFPRSLEHLLAMHYSLTACGSLCTYIASCVQRCHSVGCCSCQSVLDELPDILVWYVGLCVHVQEKLLCIGSFNLLQGGPC